MDLILLPSLFTDDAALAPVRDAVPELAVFDPIASGASLAWGDGLPTFAARLVDPLIEAHRLDDGRPVALGGVCLGGMLSMLMWPELQARGVRVERLVLLSSSPGLAEATRRWVRMVRGAAERLPRPVVHRLLGPWIRVRRSRFDTLPWTWRELRRVHAAVGLAELHLRADDVPELDVPVMHLHGGADPFLPVARVRRVVDGRWPIELVPGGGHHLALSHPEPTAAFLRRGAAPVADPRQRA